MQGPAGAQGSAPTASISGLLRGKGVRTRMEGRGYTWLNTYTPSADSRQDIKLAVRLALGLNAYVGRCLERDPCFGHG